MLVLCVNFVSSDVNFEVIESSSDRSLIKIIANSSYYAHINGATTYSWAMDSTAENVITGLIGVPPGSNVRARILSYAPMKGAANVSLNSLGVMRDYEVVQFSVPESQNNADESAFYTEEILLELEYGGGFENITPSFSFDPIYRSVLINYSNLNGNAIPGGYLIIVPDEFYDAVLPLADWKRRKGWKTTVSKLSVVGNTPAQIKAYIQYAYNSWNPAPEYVVLVGDVDKLPTFYYPTTCTDHPYSLVDGSDYLSDVLVGRISVSSVSELQVVVAKILGYEKTPYLGDTVWYKRALVVGGNYPAGVTTAILTKKWVREILLSSGYNEVDTVFYPPTTNGRVPITQSVDNGVSFVNFRGWSNYQGWHYPQFYWDDVQALSNGWKLPVVTGISCATGNFQAPMCFGEAWLRVGTVSQPKGGIAFYGPSTANTHTRFNNCIDYGIYWGIFRENFSTLGQACYRGKLELCLNFPTDTLVNFYFHYYNLLGDPELNIWTDIPESLQVQHLSSIEVGTNFFAVKVQVGVTPLSGALVSLFKEGEVETCGFTDANGFISLPIVTSAGPMFVTVTARNYIPYLGSVSVVASNVYVGVERDSIDDDTSGASQGNGDGNVNPGELIELVVSLKNYGTVNTAYNVSATLRSTDSFVTLIDSVKEFGDIPPGGIVNSSPYVFEVAPSCTNSHIIRFQLNINGSWVSELNIPVFAPYLRYISYQVVDGGNGVLDPGETAELEVRIYNSGGLGIANVQGIIQADIPAVAVVDSQGVFGDIPMGDSATNSADRFKLIADGSCAVGRSVSFTLNVSSGDYSGIVHFSIIIGEVDSTAPLGPDNYGYYAYDNTDTDYDESPVYSWVEIDPEYGGPGSLLPLGKDETRVISLPFVFRFYGKAYTRISVCSNGWLAMDSTWMVESYNWHIPSSMGAPTIIAPFWDFLNPTAGDTGNVVYYDDVSNHRFIVEWSRVFNIHEIPPNPPFPSQKQTFEVMFLDPAYYPTVTGDGELIFQYHTVVNDDTFHNYCTVGIEDETHTNGLEYTFANMYPPACAPLCNGRAIKFTTDPPDTFGGIEETNSQLSKYQLFQNYPNPFTTKTVIELRVPEFKSSVGRRTLYGCVEPRVEIYDLAGRLVKDWKLEIGNWEFHEVVWDGKDNDGNEVGSGMYFYELVAGNYKIMRKMIRLKNL